MLKRTSLYNLHQSQGAKFVEFGGWDMPVRFSGQIEEHHTVRNDAGLFDVSHMGEIFVRGKNATKFINLISSNDITKIPVGKAQYSLMLNESGGVVDDIITYKLADDNYFICVNASNTEKDFQWMSKHKIDEVEIENASDQFSQIAIQGPKAHIYLSKVLNLDIKELSKENFKTFGFKQISEFIIARTGYTGEDGFEIFGSHEACINLWNNFLELGVKPIGLGARDTLRLEAGLPLHGHELKDDLNALSSNMVWAIKLNKENFIGKAALIEPAYKLFGFEVLDKGIVRDQAKIYNKDNQEVGWVSSGTLTPTLNKAIALAFIKKDIDRSNLSAEVRGKRLALKEHALPFYKSK